jgi:hypothetical protein
MATKRKKTSEEWRRLLSEPEVGGVGAAAGASGEDAAAGLAEMALPWAAVPPGCCGWGGGDGFSLVGGGGGASPSAQQHNKNTQKPAHASVHRSHRSNRAREKLKRKVAGAERVRTCWQLVARRGGRRGDDGDGCRG